MAPRRKPLSSPGCIQSNLILIGALLIFGSFMIMYRLYTQVPVAKSHLSLLEQASQQDLHLPSGLPGLLPEQRILLKEMCRALGSEKRSDSDSEPIQNEKISGKDIVSLHTKKTDKESFGAIYVLEIQSPTPVGVVRPSKQFIVDQLKRSVESLKDTSPSIRTTLYTDSKDLDASLTSLFDNVVLVKETVTYHGERVIRALKAFPYDRVVYIDASMNFCEDISGIFAFLDNYDMAATFSTEDMTNLGPKLHRLHREFHSNTFNSGLVALKKNVRTIALIDTFLAEYQQSPLKTFGFWLARFVPASDVRMFTLPANYNLQGSSTLSFPILIQGAVMGYFLHNDTLSGMLTCKTLNQNLGMRLYFPSSSNIVKVGSSITTNDIGELDHTKHNNDPVGKLLHGDDGLDDNDPPQQQGAPQLQQGVVVTDPPTVPPSPTKKTLSEQDRKRLTEDIEG